MNNNIITMIVFCETQYIQRGSGGTPVGLVKVVGSFNVELDCWESCEKDERVDGGEAKYGVSPVDL
jgi:hypothetical protein